MNTTKTLIEIAGCGDTNEVASIVERLQYLPEYGRTVADDRFAAAMKEVADLEIKLSQARVAMRSYAEAIVRKAKSSWSEEEIAQATGY